MTVQTRRIAERLGMTIGRLSYSDTRRIVNHESLPYAVFKDGRLVRQFMTAGERLEWLEGQQDLRDLPPAPRPRPMGLP